MLYDKDIREPLLEFLEEQYGKIRLIEEKTMGHSRADMVMVTDTALVGIEIKSDADTYTRLAGQVKDYDKYFLYNVVAVGGSHGLQIHKHVPEYWGIITIDEVDGRPDFYFLRKPKANVKRKIENTLKLLWKTELHEIQCTYEMPKYRDKSRDFIRKKIMERIPDQIDEGKLEEQICRLLFERDYTLNRKKEPGHDLEAMVEEAAVRYGKKRRIGKKHHTLLH